MSLRETLRAATRASHERVESALELEVHGLERYARYLAAMHAVHAAAGPVLACAGWPMGAVRWLEDDLAFLGVESTPALEWRPRNDATLAGCAYVLEGAALGGRALYKRWAPRHGLAVSRGATFLHGHGEATGVRWTRFVQRLDALPLGAREIEGCVHAANGTFAAILAAFERDCAAIS